MLKQLDPNSLDSGFLSAVTRLDTVATFTIYLSQASVEMSGKKSKPFKSRYKTNDTITALCSVQGAKRKIVH